MNKAIHCTRCQRRWRGAEDWNVNVENGIPVEIICPGCQTSAEHLEAEVNLATIDYVGVGPDGRLWGKAKSQEAGL